MPPKKYLPRNDDGVVDIKDARKKMRGHRTNAEIENKAQTEVKAAAPLRISVPKYLPEQFRAEFKSTAKALAALGIYSNLDADMLARYFVARASWFTAQAEAARAIRGGDLKAVVEWTRTVNVYFAQCQSCAAALGLSVTSRCRLTLPQTESKPKEKDAMTELLEAQAARRKRQA